MDYPSVFARVVPLYQMDISSIEKLLLIYLKTI